jgi:hypothetical protein
MRSPTITATFLPSNMRGVSGGPSGMCLSRPGWMEANMPILPNASTIVLANRSPSDPCETYQTSTPFVNPKHLLISAGSGISTISCENWNRCQSWCVSRTDSCPSGLVPSMTRQNINSFIADMSSSHCSGSIWRPALYCASFSCASAAERFASATFSSDRRCNSPESARAFRENSTSPATPRVMIASTPTPPHLFTEAESETPKANTTSSAKPNTTAHPHRSAQTSRVNIFSSMPFWPLFISHRGIGRGPHPITAILAAAIVGGALLLARHWNIIQ